MASVDKQIGQRVRDAREAADLTQLDLADLIGLARSSVANIEAGVQPLSAARLVVVAEALGVTGGWLLGEPGDRGVPPSLVTAVTGAVRRLAGVHREIVDLMDGVMGDIERCNRIIERSATP